VLGHRGASAQHPENTLLAFRQALREGADGVELDVMRCASGEVVVVHDDDLRRVTGEAAGSGLLVRQATLTELRRFDLGRGERVPTLEEVLEELGGDALVNVELKSAEARTARQHLRLLHDDGLAQATVCVLRRSGRLDEGGAERTLLSSFDPLQLVRVRRHLARLGRQLPLGYLFHDKQAAPLRRAWPALLLGTEAVHPSANLIDAAAVRGWRRHGFLVHVWTVDDEREVRALCALGVDGIITNRPAAVCAVVRGM
jgi:glycerophosphoryl diester phosphodiesterase